MAFKGDNDALILGVLAERSLHGYEISKQIKLKSKGSLTLPENKLYPALHKLEELGMITSEWVPQHGKPDRKVYSINPEGTKELESHRSAWRKFMANINSVMMDAVVKEGQ
jgi:DNA-binding PadR family transcriptional regulator